MRRIVPTGIVIYGILAMLFVGAWPCREAYSEPAATITIGTTTSEVNSLILIAQDHGYFTSNGLTVTHKIYSSGLAAVDGMFKNEVI